MMDKLDKWKNTIISVLLTMALTGAGSYLLFAANTPSREEVRIMIEENTRSLQDLIRQNAETVQKNGDQIGELIELTHELKGYRDGQKDSKLKE